MSNHILAKLSQICTAVGANQQSSSAFMQLQVLVSCLHCYQMKLPYTNQINQQLPIFQNCIKSMYATAEISEPHRTRAKQGAGSCKWASTQTLFQLHYGPPWPTMAYHGLPWSTKIHGFNLYFKSVSSMFILHLWCTFYLPFPVSNSTNFEHLWTIPTVPKNNTALPALLLEEVEAFQQCHGNWPFTFPSSQLVQKTICIRWESKHSFVLFKFEARTLWQPSERFPISFWLQTWGNCRAASKQRSTRAKEPTAFHFALCYVKPYLSTTVTDLHSSWSKSAKQLSIHVAPSACFVPALLPDEAASYKSDKPATSNLPGHWLILASIELHQVYVRNRRDLRAPPNPRQTGSWILQVSIHSNSLPAALWSTMAYHGLPWPTVVHENTWIQFLLQKCFINVHLASLVHITCLSRFQTPRTLNIFEPFQRYQKITQLCLRCCWKKLKPFSSVMATDSLPSLPHNLFKNHLYKMREQVLTRAVQVWSEDTVTTIRTLSNQFLTANLRQLQSRFQTT